MIPTPDISHLTKEDFDRIYEPAGDISCSSIVMIWTETGVFHPEDTFLLLDALEEDAEELKAMKPRICLEIG